MHTLAATGSQTWPYRNSDRSWDSAPGKVGYESVLPSRNGRFHTLPRPPSSGDGARRRAGPGDQGAYRETWHRLHRVTLGVNPQVSRPGRLRDATSFLRVFWSQRSRQAWQTRPSGSPGNLNSSGPTVSLWPTRPKRRCPRELRAPSGPALLSDVSEERRSDFLPPRLHANMPYGGRSLDQLRRRWRRQNALPFVASPPHRSPEGPLVRSPRPL